MLVKPVRDQLFYAARPHNARQGRAVSEAKLQELKHVMKWAPTSANMSSARIVFVVTPAAKNLLKPLLTEGNIEKTMAAPDTAIIGYNPKFHDPLPKLFPHTDARA